MHDLMGDDAAQMPEAIKGVMLSCILSDTLAFRSPTTTPQDKALAESLAAGSEPIHCRIRRGDVCRKI